MMLTAAVLLVQQTLVAVGGAQAPVSTSLTPPHVALAAAGLGRCADPWDTRVSDNSPARDVHPERLRVQFAKFIVARDWETVLAGYAATIDGTLAQVAQPAKPAYDTLRAQLDSAVDSVVAGVSRALRLPKIQLAAALVPLSINQFRPFQSPDGDLRILQSDPNRPTGIVVDSTRLSPDQMDAICWSGWSLYRLLHNINFETIPGALARVEGQERRWERYRTQGPMQLPHEMVLNRIRRFAFPPRGAARFNPPRLDLVAVHPFAGIELVRTDNGVARSESVAAELGGATLWINDWKQHVGASWVMAYDADGRIGRGPLVRLGGYATAGVLSRKDAGGKSRKSLLINVDALRLLKPDAAPQAVRQLQSVAGEVLNRLP